MWRFNFIGSVAQAAEPIKFVSGASGGRHRIRQGVEKGICT